MANEVSSISYNGNVKISFVSKSGRPIKTIERHNKGCKPLFNFITSCMMGNYNESNRPVYLMLYKKGLEISGSNLGVNRLPNLQYVVNAEMSYDSENDAGIVKYKFIFPGSLLKEPADVIALYNYNNAQTFKLQGDHKPSNYVEMGTITPEEVANLNVVVIWELQFSNKESE